MEDALIIAAFSLLGAFIALALYRLIYTLRENDRMKDEFITIIAHKFRTPLSQSKWIIENMQANDQNGYNKEGLEEMNKLNEHLISITNAMVELADSDRSSRGVYSYERVELTGFVRAIVGSQSARFHEKNIFLEIRCPEEEIWAKIDRARFEFVMRVLLENARIYTPPGRNVQIMVSTARSAMGFRTEAVIWVIDDGIGIDPSDRRKVFKEFFRAENARAVDTEGFGIGLFLARSIVRRHYGKIGFSSEGLDKGSAFYVRIPEAR